MRCSVFLVMQLGKKSMRHTSDSHNSSILIVSVRVERRRSKFENLIRNFVNIFEYFSQFQAVSEAHRVLTDPELRDIYDKHGSEAVQLFLEQVDGKDEAYRARARVCFRTFFTGTIKNICLNFIFSVIYLRFLLQ